MFPREGAGGAYAKDAKKVCDTCPVQPECLDYALQFHPGELHGMWAGMTGEQLRREQNRRGISPSVPSVHQIIEAWARQLNR